MQIPPLGAGSLQPERSLAAGSHGVSGATAPTATQATVPSAALARPARPTPPTATALPRPGLQVLQDGRNERVASAQQALLYLDRLSTRLQHLKSDLGNALAGRPVPTERLEGQRQALAQLWQQRQTQAGGQLDNQLRYVPDGVPTQGFTVRGLDANAPLATASETLTFAIGLPTSTRPAARVPLAPEATAQTQSRSFQYALAPLGLRVQAAPGGGLRFEVDEARWPQVRDQLAIQGEGRRFPAGRLHHVQTDPEPAALTPQALALEDSPAGRVALQQVITALGRTERARQDAHAVLEQDRAQLDQQPPAGDSAWAQGFAADFAQATQDTARWNAGSYGIRAALGAAVSGVERHRVSTLLA